MVTESPLRKRRRSSNPQPRRSRGANNPEFISRAPGFLLLMRYEPFPTREEWEIQRQEIIILRRYEEKLNREKNEWEYFRSELKEKYISLRRGLKEMVLGNPNFKYLDHLTLDARDYMIRLAKDEEKLNRVKFCSLEIAECLNLLVAKLDLLDKEYKLFVDKYKRIAEEVNKRICRERVRRILPTEPELEGNEESDERCIIDDEYI